MVVSSGDLDRWGSGSGACRPAFLARRMPACKSARLVEKCISAQCFEARSAPSVDVHSQHADCRHGQEIRPRDRVCQSRHARRRGGFAPAGRKTRRPKSRPEDQPEDQGGRPKKRGDQVVAQESRIAGVKRGGVRTPSLEVGRRRKGGTARGTVTGLAGLPSARHMPTFAMRPGMRLSGHRRLPGGRSRRRWRYRLSRERRAGVSGGVRFRDARAARGPTERPRAGPAWLQDSVGGVMPCFLSLR